jgi:hypothetical protein
MVEQYAEFSVEPDALWDVVRRPGRLPEWTQGRAVDPPEHWEVGRRVRITERETVEWEVLSAEPRVVELRGTTPCGELGIGVRVVAGTGGSPTRVVFVARLDSTRTVRARLRDLPAMRRRFDRWAHGLRRVASG